MSGPIAWAEQGWLPDWLVRRGMRGLLRQRLRELPRGNEETAQALHEFLQRMRQGPIAMVPESANAQHYEIPASFFQQVLGPHLKYSSGLWPPGCQTLKEAEAAMLALTCERADLQDGQDILELGCGWGSLSLFMAERFPRSRITAVSNSLSQKQFIEARCRDLSVTNLQVLTRDMNDLALKEEFDRVVSVEMFEHLHNWEKMLRHIAGWMKPRGKVFIHIFCHRAQAYFFDTAGSSNWLGRFFFTGGMMPADALLLYCQGELAVERHWRVDGRHYEKTANAWLANLDRNRQEVETLFRESYGTTQAQLWAQRWRMFFMACAELFGYQRGQEWYVGHYLLRKRELTPSRTQKSASFV